MSPSPSKNSFKKIPGCGPRTSFASLRLRSLNGPASQILALKYDQIKSNQYRVITVALVADQIEYRENLGIGDDGFTVDQERGLLARRLLLSPRAETGP